MLYHECHIGQEVEYNLIRSTIFIIIETNGPHYNEERGMRKVRIQEKNKPSNAGWVPVDSLVLKQGIDTFLGVHRKHGVKKVIKEPV